MAKIYVIEGTEKSLNKIQEPISLIRKGWKKLLTFLNNFFYDFYFFQKLSEKYFIVKEKWNFFGPYNICNSLT